MYYHVCLSCTAKFFTEAKERDCPRCGDETRSEFNDTLPWDHIQTAAELEERTKLEKQRIHQLYLQQQRRLACPGCGEAPFLG